MTPEEFIDALESVTESLRNNKTANQQQAEQLLKSIGIDKTRADEVLKAGKQFGTSSATMVKGMAAGADSAKSMANALDTVVTGLELLLALIPGYRLLKIAILVTTKALAGLTKAATEQAQAEFKAYQDLSRIGARFSSLNDVFDTVQKFGYNVGELDKMVALIAENSNALAKFGGTAAQGTTAFADAMNQLTHGQAGVELGALGKNLDDVNAAGANYIRLQLQMGRTQKDIGNSLADGTKKYIYDLNRLQELTGTSADALAKKQQEAFAESAYAALINRLSKGSAADQAQAKKIQDINSVLGTASAEDAKLFRQGIGGNIGAAGSINFTMQRLLRDARDSSTSFATTLQNAAEDSKRFTDATGGLFEIAAESAESTFGKYQNQIDIQLAFADAEARLAKINARTTDENVKNMAKATVADRQRTANLQTMIQHGVGPATTALAGLADAANAVTGALPGTKGVTTDAGKVPAGLKIKGSESTSGGPADPKLYKLAQQIQDSLGAGQVKHFSAFNDAYHKGMKSNHNKGTALDLVLTDPSRAAAVTEMLKAMPEVGKVENEYLKRSRNATGGHIHVEIAKPSGPNDTYNQTTSDIKPASTLPAGADSAQAQYAARNTQSEEILTIFSDRLEEVIRPLKQVADNTSNINRNTA